MSKIRKSAKLEECQVRVPELCNFDETTTVFAHIGGAGMGIKSNDIHGAYCCSACHDVIDGRVKSNYSINELKLMHLDGVIRTQLILIKKGHIKI